MRVGFIFEYSLKRWVVVPEVLRLQTSKMRVVFAPRGGRVTYLFQFLFHSRFLLRFDAEANSFRTFIPFGFSNQRLSFPNLCFLSQFQHTTFQCPSALGPGQVELVLVRHTRQELCVDQLVQKRIILSVRSEIVSALEGWKGREWGRRTNLGRRPHLTLFSLLYQ